MQLDKPVSTVDDCFLAIHVEIIWKENESSNIEVFWEAKESVKLNENIEMRKLNKRKIREDISKDNEKLIEVIESNKSLKKAHKRSNGWIWCV